MINNFLSEEIENEIIKNIKKNGFFDVFELYLRSKGIILDLDEKIEVKIGELLKNEDFRYGFEEFLLNKENLDNDLLNLYLVILKEIDNFYNFGNNGLIRGVNNINYKKTDEEIEIEETKKLIAKILIKKGNKVNKLIYNQEVLVENGELEKVTIMLNFFRLKVGGVISIFSNDLEQLSVYNLLEVLNFSSEYKIKYLEKEIKRYESMAIMDIKNMYNFYGLKILSIKYAFIDKGNLVMRDGLLTDNGNFLNIENRFFMDEIVDEFEIGKVKFLRTKNKDGIFGLFDRTGKVLKINGKYIYDIKESALSLNQDKYYELNNGNIILSKIKLFNELDKYTSLDSLDFELELN